MKKMPIFWILKRIRRRIPAIMVMTLAHVGDSLLAVLFALGSRNVIDSAISGDSGAFLRACIQQGGVVIGMLLCLTLFRHLRDKLSAELERDWKRQLLHGLLHGDYQAVSGYHSAELLNRLNNDVAKVNTGILAVIPNAASMVARVIAAVAVLGVLDAWFTVVIAVLGAGAIGATGLVRRRLKALNKQVSDHDGKVSGLLQESMEKLLMVQSMDVSEEVERRTENLMADRFAVQRKRKNVSLLANTAVSLLRYGAGFLALCWCAYRLIQGRMSVGSVTAVIQLVNQLQIPFVNLSGVVPQYIAMTASAERLMELEAVTGEPVAPMEDTQGVYQRMTTLQAENLSFAYDRDEVLREVSFQIPKGSFCVITGQSGAGKSTILKLLLGVYRKSGGELQLVCQDGKVDIDRRTRKIFAYVPQGNLLLSGTLRENLLLAKPDATDGEIDQAVYCSAMDAYLPQLPQGLDTRLGEDGVGLSEGQAQRLAIARAVLSGAPVLLLDESTSALDIQTEQLVLQRIRELPDRTCIVVTHREAAVAYSDCRIHI